MFHDVDGTHPNVTLMNTSWDLALRGLSDASAKDSTALVDYLDVGSLGTDMATVTQGEAQYAMHRFQQRTSAEQLDRSCTCACCGRMVSPSAATFSLSDPHLEELFMHERCCRRGFPLSSIEREHETDAGDLRWVKGTRHTGVPLAVGKKRATRVRVPLPLLEVDWDGEFDPMVDDGEQQYAEGRLATIGRQEGSDREVYVNIKFDDLANQVLPPPCSGDMSCPLRSQVRGRADSIVCPVRSLAIKSHRIVRGQRATPAYSLLRPRVTLTSTTDIKRSRPRTELGSFIVSSTIGSGTVDVAAATRSTRGRTRRRFAPARVAQLRYGSGRLRSPSIHSSTTTCKWCRRSLWITLALWRRAKTSRTTILWSPTGVGTKRTSASY